MTAAQVAPDGREPWIAQFDAAADRRRGEPSWLAALRREAIAVVGRTGLPTARDEDWRSTNLAPIVRTTFRPAQPEGLDFEHPALVEALGLVPTPAARLVFVDGVYEPALSYGTTNGGGKANGGGATPRFTASSLARAIERNPEALAPALGRVLPRNDGDPRSGRSAAFATINLALFEDGAYVGLPREASLAAPIQLVFVTVAGVEATASHPRVVIVGEAGSRGSVVETHVAIGDGASFSNAVTEVVCGQSSHLDHVRVLQGTDGSLHVGAVHAVVGRDASFGSLSLVFGGRLSRVDVDVLLSGEGGACSLDGLYVARGREHIDHHTRIEHAVPRCTSREVYKGVLDGDSTAAFAGRIRVREGAQKTDARQANHTLLLSTGATIDTKPELEIFADDVKCAHGATVGQIDEEAVFYLRSRGIERATARAMLVHAFASEVLRRASPSILPERLEELLAGRLPFAVLEEAVRGAGVSEGAGAGKVRG